MSAVAPLVRMRGITRRFASVVANDEVDLDLYPGEVHALVGENGSGKSTLMHILSGLDSPDAGELFVDEESARFDDPADALALGIGMVHQKPALIDSLTVSANLRLGLDLSRREFAARFEEIRARYGLSVSPGARVSSLTDAAKEHVALFALLLRRLRLFILDEPSSSFSSEDEDRYFAIVESIAGEGSSVLFITHKLKEITRIADRVTVMRRGEVVLSETVRPHTDSEIRSLVFGNHAANRKAIVESGDRGEEVLGFTNVSVIEGGATRLEAIDLSVHRGEVVVVAGLREHGPEVLEEICAGERRPSTGSIRLGGREVALLSPRLRRRNGVGEVPADRYETGVSGANRVWENLVAVRRKLVHRGGVLDRGAVREVTTRLLGDAGVSVSPDARTSSLSGGMIQRLIFARELDASQMLLVVREPFWGLDGEGRARMTDRIGELTSRGVGVIAFVSDIDDVGLIADTVVVFRHGRIVGVRKAAGISRDSIADLVLGLGELR